MSPAELETLAASAAARYGVNPTALLTVLSIENPARDPAAVNPLSGATGLGQFMPATARQYGLADATDPAASIDAAARLMRDNAASLSRTLGRDPTVGEQYLAYQQGATGASRLLANPDRPASQIVGTAAVQQNGGDPSMTAGQFARMWTSRADQTATRLPPADVPTTPIRAAYSVAGPATGFVPFAAPAPLTPDSMQSGSPLDKLPESAMYGLQRRLTPGQVTAPPTDFTTQDTGSPDLRLLGLAAPKLPTADVIDPNGSLSWNMLQDFADSGTKAPSVPTPFPTPSFALPRAPQLPQVQTASYSPASSTPNLVKLPSGKMIAPGTYPSQSNPGSMVTVSDDGNGNAIVKESNLGFMNPAKMGPGTLANDYIHSQIGPAVSSAVNNVKAVVAPQASAFAGDITNGAKALGGQIGGMFSNMFGGGNSAPPTPPLPIPTAPAAPQFTTAQVPNPAYAAYLAAQRSNEIPPSGLLGNDFGAGPGSFSDLQAMNGATFPIPHQAPSFALPRMPAPPRFITVTRPVAVPAVAPVMPPVIAPQAPPPMPAQPPGASFLAARGVDTSNMSAGQQANALWQSLGGSSQRGSFHP